MYGKFFYLILLSGVAIICVAIFLIMKDNKKNRELVRIAETEKDELKSIIDDAELMVDELNNFSDYIITEIEKKNSEVDLQLSMLDEKLKKAMETQVHLDMTGARMKAVKVLDETYENETVLAMPDTKRMVYRIERRSRSGAVAGEKSRDEGSSIIDERTVNEETVDDIKKSAILVLNDKKYGNVLKYANEGMSDTDIAKTLNIGKGEVQLIIGLKDNYEKS